MTQHEQEVLADWIGSICVLAIPGILAALMIMAG